MYAIWGKIAEGCCGVEGFDPEMNSHKHQAKEYFFEPKRLHLRLFWLRLIGVAILVAITGWALQDMLPLAWIYFTQ